MSRYIDVDAVMHELDREVELADDWKTAHKIANVVKYFPTADVVEKDEVIRKLNEIERRVDELEKRVAVLEQELASILRENVHGEWIPTGQYSHSYKCSVCGRTLFNITDGAKNVSKHYPFCHCGAEMRKERKNEQIH